MRIVASAGWALYLLDTAGKLHFVPKSGQPGYWVAHPELEVRSLRRHAAEYRQEGNRRRYKLLRRAAVALEKMLRGEPARAVAA